MVMADELGHTPIVRRREDVYELLFGRYETVYHPPVDVLPHIDVYVHAPTAERVFFTLVTGGMSDAAMSAPTGAPRRSELVAYTSDKAARPEAGRACRDTVRPIHLAWLGPFERLRTYRAFVAARSAASSGATDRAGRLPGLLPRDRSRTRRPLLGIPHHGERARLQGRARNSSTPWTLHGRRATNRRATPLRHHSLGVLVV